MQIEYLQTFLELARSGSFSRTAKTLFVSQSTVSTRIKLLEETLDRVLLSRTRRGGVSLTRAGEQFHRYALGMTKMWQQALQEVALPEGYRLVLSLGAQPSLWEQLVLHWIPWMREHASDVGLHVDAADAASLVDALNRGRMDIAVMYEPQTAPGIVIERLMEERLILVSSRKRRPSTTWVEDYVYVDWGEAFRRQHADAFSEVEMPSITLNQGDLALRHLLQSGGSGYFPLRLVRPHLTTKRLVRVARSPVFRRPVFVAFAADREDSPVMQTALRGLKRAAKRR